jgi:hypothetical protein
VVDGQGGGIGVLLIRKLRETFGNQVDIIALGTNAIATANMLKAGANRGASGENAICHTVPAMDFILGTVAVTWANAMMGEVTETMAAVITSSPALKILLPLSQERVEIVGIGMEPLPHLVEMVMETMKGDILDV